MTNQMIILLESIKLMDEGKIKGSGIKGLNPDGKEIELPEAIHTYQIWKQLGFQVKKGEKAVAQFPIWKHTSKATEEIDENGDPKVKENMFLKTSSFFTKAQVEPIKKKEVQA